VDRLSSEPNSEAISIRLARPSLSDADAFARFLVEHVAESGQNGMPAFAFARRISRIDARDAALTRWDRPLHEPLWGRAFLLLAEGRVVGHLELKGGRLLAEMHRAVLGMGLLQRYTGQGHGRRLIEIAVTWARNEAGLFWIDLGVFSHNARARALYKRMGFVEQGSRPDAFRLDDGTAVDDIQMALDLRCLP